MNNRIRKDFSGNEAAENRFAKPKGMLNRQLIDLSDERLAPIWAVVQDMVTAMRDKVPQKGTGYVDLESKIVIDWK